MDPAPHRHGGRRRLPHWSPRDGRRGSQGGNAAVPDRCRGGRRRPRRRVGEGGPHDAVPYPDTSATLVAESWADHPVALRPHHAKPHLKPHLKSHPKPAPRQAAREAPRQAPGQVRPAAREEGPLGIGGTDPEPGPRARAGESAGELGRMVVTVATRHTRTPHRRSAGGSVVTPIDPTGAAFLFAENRSMPMHVGGLQLFEKPEVPGATTRGRCTRGDARRRRGRALFLKRPHRSLLDGGSTRGVEDEQSRHRAPRGHSAPTASWTGPRAARACRPAAQHPLPGLGAAAWEAHVIEGLKDGRVALYTKTHHALVDGISAMRLLQGVLSTDPTSATCRRSLTRAPGASSLSRSPTGRRERLDIRPRRRTGARHRLGGSRHARCAG